MARKEPTIKDLQVSVRDNLGIRQDLGPNLVPYVTFSPTIGIVAARIDTLGAKITSFEEPLRKAIRDVIIPSIQVNFDVGGRPSWAPLSDATQEIRTMMGEVMSIRPLVKTSALKNTMAQEDIWTVNSGMAILPSLPENVWYGNIHQGGYEGRESRTSAGGGYIKSRADWNKQKSVSAIPERPFAVLQPKDEDDISDIFVEWLGEKIEEAWPIGL